MLKQFLYKIFGTHKMTEITEGTVKFFNTTKGFGFIRLKDSDDDIFVHSTNLIDKIKENDRVTFDIEKGDRGLTAIKVRVM